MITPTSIAPPSAIDRPGARKRYENACREIENIVVKWGEKYDINTVN